MFTEKPVAEYMEDLLSEDERIRTSARSSLGDYSADILLPEMSALLRKPDKRIRNCGMELFCCMGSLAVPTLGALLGDEEWIVRYRAAEALGIIGGDDACVLLVPALRDRKDHVRYMAAKGLGISSYTEAADAVAPLLDDTNEFVRASAARAIGQMHIPAYAPDIEAALQREEYEKTRSAMIEALSILNNE